MVETGVLCRGERVCTLSCPDICLSTDDEHEQPQMQGRALCIECMLHDVYISCLPSEADMLLALSHRPILLHLRLPVLKLSIRMLSPLR